MHHGVVNGGTCNSEPYPSSLPSPLREFDAAQSPTPLRSPEVSTYIHMEAYLTLVTLPNSRRHWASRADLNGTPACLPTSLLSYISFPRHICAVGLSGPCIPRRRHGDPIETTESGLGWQESFGPAHFIIIIIMGFLLYYQCATSKKQPTCSTPDRGGYPAPKDKPNLGWYIARLRWSRDSKQPRE